MSSTRTRNLVRGGLAVAAVALAGLHLQILWARVADGSVLDPLVAARWLGSIAVGLCFLTLRRRGLSVLRGRASLILWLVVALLHGAGLLPAVAATGPGVMPAEIFWIATPLGVGAVALGWAAAFYCGRRGSSLFALRVRRLGASVRRQSFAVLSPAAVGPRGPPA